ncbi:MAG: LAGLIDADG family homing endonuclease [bacterium]|nr:LAGLIDADG family homing endonuclease [bacterium]
MGKLPGDYIAGFVDGEGCFALKFRRDVRHDRKNKPIYFYWDIEFAIMLKGDDKEILYKIRDTLKCGKVGNIDKRGLIRYAINNINDLSNKVVPFFQKYPLHAKKRHDFDLWKKAVAIFKIKQQLWDQKTSQRLIEIREAMKQYKGGNRSNWKWL